MLLGEVCFSTRFILCWWNFGVLGLQGSLLYLCWRRSSKTEALLLLSAQALIFSKSPLEILPQSRGEFKEILL